MLFKLVVFHMVIGATHLECISEQIHESDIDMFDILYFFILIIGAGLHQKKNAAPPFDLISFIYGFI